MRLALVVPAVLVASLYAGLASAKEPRTASQAHRQSPSVARTTYAEVPGASIKNYSSRTAQKELARQAVSPSMDPSGAKSRSEAMADRAAKAERKTESVHPLKMHADKMKKGACAATHGKAASCVSEVEEAPAAEESQPNDTMPVNLSEAREASALSRILGPPARDPVRIAFGGHLEAVYSLTASRDRAPAFNAGRQTVARAPTKRES